MNLEDKRNQLNLELRTLLSVIDMIDGLKKDYPDYVVNSNISEEEYITQQLALAKEAREKLIAILKD